jgi:large subunit ribosomal protein L15
VEMLNAFPAGETVTPELLRATGLIRELRAAIKVLGDGDLNVALTVHAHKFSKSAEEKITRAGGKVEILP